MKKRLAFAVLALTSVILGGCLFVGTGPELTVAVSPSAGHPPFTINIAAACSVPDGTYTFTPPNGDPIESDTGSFTAVVADWPYKASVTWTKGTQSVTEPVRLTLVNQKPVAHELLLARVTYREQTIIDLRYRLSGCDNGNPINELGIEDPDYTADGYSPDNDNFLYYVEVYDTDTGVQETVYKEDGTPLAYDEYVSSAIFYWFPGWTIVHAPYPIKCGPTPPPDIPDQDGAVTAHKTIHVYVKEFGSLSHWTYQTDMVGGSCSQQP